MEWIMFEALEDHEGSIKGRKNKNTRFAVDIEGLAKHNVMIQPDIHYTLNADQC